MFWIANKSTRLIIYVGISADYNAKEEEVNNMLLLSPSPWKLEKAFIIQNQRLKRTSPMGH